MNTPVNMEKYGTMQPTNIENLHVNQWVAVVESRSGGDDCDCLNCKPLDQFNGAPLQVVAISPPWVLVRDLSDSLRTLDLRDHGLRKLNRGFVRAIRNAHFRPPIQTQAFNCAVHETKDYSYFKRCPNCGSYTNPAKREGDHGWNHRCPICGLWC